MKNEYRLILQAKRNPERFLELYDHYYPKLYAYILSRTRHKEATEDIVQQTFVKALDNIHTFTWKKSATFGSWLFRIARNQMIDSGKKNARIQLMDASVLETIEHKESGIDEMIDQSKMTDVVLHAMNKLTEEEREVIVLKYFSELSYKEMSGILEKKPNTLAVILRRSLQKIRIELEV